MKLLNDFVIFSIFFEHAILVNIELPPRWEPQSGGSGASNIYIFLRDVWHAFLALLFGWIGDGFDHLLDSFLDS